MEAEQGKLGWVGAQAFDGSNAALKLSLNYYLTRVGVRCRVRAVTEQNTNEQRRT